MKSYVKVFNGHEVPEGATHQASDTSFVLFAKWIGNHPVFFDVRNDSWVEDKLIGRHFFKELPEAPQYWQPAVGESCQYTTTFFTMQPKVGVCSIIAVYKDKVWIDIKGNNEYVINTNSIKFFPLKTAKELEREALHLAVIDACMPIHSDDFNIDEIAGALFHAGFTAPKESK
jgi:hypothetical protein